MIIKHPVPKSGGKSTEALPEKGPQKAGDHARGALRPGVFPPLSRRREGPWGLLSRSRGMPGRAPVDSGGPGPYNTIIITAKEALICPL